MWIPISVTLSLLLTNTFATEIKNENTTSSNIEATTLNYDVLLNRKVRNIHIEPHYNSERNKIMLDISWNQPIDLEFVQYYDFVIASTSNYHECVNVEFKTIKKSKNLTSIQLPPKFHSYELAAGCSYKIIIISQGGHLGKVEASFAYVLPECIGKKCSCRNLAPHISNIKATEFNPGALNISWEINHYGINTTVNNITNITFEYRPTKGNQTHHNPFLLLQKLSNVKFKSYFVINGTNKAFSSNTKYQLQATFYNIYKCKVVNYTYFTVKSLIKNSLENKSTTAYWEITLFVIMLLFMLLTVIYLLRRNRFVLKEFMRHPLSLHFIRRNAEEPSSYVMVPTVSKNQTVNILYVDQEIINGDVDSYEIPRSRIQFIKEIGEGAFGQVFLAKAFNVGNQIGYTHVAVKTLREKAPAEEMDDFLSEIDILKKVGEHPNIVRIYGCCIIKEPYLIVMEFVPCGDLKHYLLDLREKWKRKRSRNDSTPVFSECSDGAYVFPDTPRSRIQSNDPSLPETEYIILENEESFTEMINGNIDTTLNHTELQRFALQIAKGMEHLEKIPIVHRDLAARNILISMDKTLKISDFGLSRICPYVNQKTKKMPLRWVAIEAIEDHFYDGKSDVWSFAVVLWEIGTLGAFPYENVQDNMVLHYLQQGGRLPRPEICTDDLYSLMSRCWSQDSELRPTFQELVQLLEENKKNIYVDFSQLNPLYVFPPDKSETID